MQMHRKSIGILLGVTASGLIVAARTDGASSPSARLSTAAPPELTFAAVTVVATPPTISEILDIILGDNPDNRAVAASETGTTAKAPAGGIEEARIATMLRSRTPDADRAQRIAAALVREGRRANLGSTLLVGVLLTENPDLDPRATSPVGARGLMQVMPLHAGKWGCPSGDLLDIESNICHGVRILADDLRQSHSLPAALLRYNGCVRGTNTPDCYLYARAVYRYARRSAAGANGKITSATPFSREGLSIQ
jgi:soluble lytic murein transglycosylase-like protein